MAWYPTLTGPALDAYRKMVASLVAKAQKETGLSLAAGELVVRELRPEDLGASSADFYVGTKATDWYALIDSKTIEDNRWVGINGVYMGGATAGTMETAVGNESAVLPQVSQIKIERMGSVARYWVVEPIQSFENFTGWCDDPITIDQNTTVTISAWARTASSLQKFKLLGAVVEKKGILISP